MKTCPEKDALACPTGYNGCQQSRKLLAHYRRCRSIRVKQAGQATRGNEQHHCLVCSLVARQARSMLDRSASKSTRKTSSSAKHSVISSLALSSSSATPSSSNTKNRLHKDLSSSSSSQKMPPPLHARRLLSSSAKVADVGQRHHHHQDFPNIQSITIAVDSSLHDNDNDEEKQFDQYHHHHHHDLLGSSLDSARDSILRARSASVAVAGSFSSVVSARHRSASMGGATLAQHQPQQQQQQQQPATTYTTTGSTSSLLSTGSCETIHEEGCCSDTSSVDKSRF